MCGQSVSTVHSKSSGVNIDVCLRVQHVTCSPHLVCLSPTPSCLQDAGEDSDDDDDDFTGADTYANYVPSKGEY